MSKYILVRIDEKYASVDYVLEVLKNVLNDTLPLYDCTGADLYYGFENCAENLDNVTMIAIGVKEEE